MNLSKEEWEKVCSLATDCNIVIKKAGKGSCVVISGRLHYIIESEKQLSDISPYKKTQYYLKYINNLFKINEAFRNFLHTLVKLIKQKSYIKMI